MSTIFTVTEPITFWGLAPGVNYYVVHSPSVLQRVLLVSFEEQVHKPKRVRTRKAGIWKTKTVRKPKTRCAKLAILPRAEFEALLDLHLSQDQRRSKLTGETDGMPPWLDKFRGTQFDTEERFQIPRHGQPLSALDYVDDRVIKLQPAIETERLREVLSAPDPDRALNAIARGLSPRINETRFRLWFFLYLAFDYRKWVLLPAWTDGQWDREGSQYASSAPGRPSQKPGMPRAQRLSAEDRAILCDGFLRLCLIGDTWPEVWARVVRKCFNATVVETGGTRKYQIQIADRPIPVLTQFRRCVIQKFGKDEVKAHFIGHHRFRNEEQPFLGSQFDDLTNIGERAHYDSSSIPERPKAFLGNYHLEPIHCVDLVDGRSGQILGIGFSIGSEQGRAYKAALFCAAIPKTKFGQIIGYPIADDDWPGHGLPSALVSDGGPGFSSDVVASYAKWNISPERAPSYQPMSNSTTESKHHRRARREGAPEIRLSQLNAVDITKREAQRVIKKNRSDNVLARSPDRAIEAGVRSPNDLHRYMNERMRSSFIQVQFDDAVRTFLDPIVIQVQRGRLYFIKREYRPEAPRRSDLTRQLANQNGLELRGYALQFAPRHIWVEWLGKLYEVNAVIDGGDPAKFATVPEIEKLAAYRARASGDTQAALPLEVFAAQERFYQETGIEMSAGRTVRGKKKRSKDADDEMRLLKQKEVS